MKQALKTTLRELTAIHGAPGFEADVVAYLVEAFKPLTDEIEVDTFGNLYATRHGAESGLRLMLDAHSDEIGCMVKSVEPDGFLRFERLGGTLPVLLVGRKVWVNGHLGVIGVRSGHLQKPEEREKVPPVEEMYIDVGAASAEEVAAMGIRIGDPVTYLSALQAYTNPDRLCGKAIDNRLGCAILLQLFRKLAGTDLAGTVHAVVAVQEEVGLRGAAVAAYKLHPDYAIAVDTFMSGDTPDVHETKEMPVGIGRGPVLLLASGGSRMGNIAHPVMKRWLIEAAERAGVPYQLATVLLKAATDASAIHLAREGIPTGGVGLARRYSHSPVCTFDINDAVGAVELLGAFVADMANHTKERLIPVRAAG